MQIMSRKFLIIILLVISATATHNALMAQNNNPLSVYEGEGISSVTFDFVGSSAADSALLNNRRGMVENAFKVFPNTQFSSFMASYYASKVEQLPFVASAKVETSPSAEQTGVAVRLIVAFASTDSQAPLRKSVFKKGSMFPTLYSSPATFLTLKFSASEMVYSNNNAWFGEPSVMLDGNPLAKDPVGRGYTGWVEGFAMGGLYGVQRISQKGNLHLYGGASYIVSFTAGAELFDNKSRFYGDIEEAFLGLTGGGRTKTGHNYAYNLSYGRKQFTLGDGFLLINTAMNGDNRAALQLNPRWSASRLALLGASWDRIMFEAFSLRPNELSILSSHTTIQGLNLELGNVDRMLIGLSFLTASKSNLRYYMPDGTTHTREGLQVYNLRVFGNQALTRPGLFYKAEVAFEYNPNFDMQAWAYYGELGWSFAGTRGRPSLSYRYASFSGDNPATSRYERWDPLYTGGNGQQWVQGSNMYKIVQNSNEISHRLQLIYSPVKKTQLVAQLWAFYAPQTMNLGGNPALSVLKSKYYGTELNLTFKYYPSSHWYYHLNAAFTVPGEAVRLAAPGAASWFSLMVFARYSL